MYALLKVCVCVESSADHLLPIKKGFQPLCLPLQHSPFLGEDRLMTRVSPPQALRLAAPCVTRHSNSQPLVRLDPRPSSCHPVIRRAQVGSERVFFFDGLVTVLWLIALRPKLAAGGPRQRLNKEGQKGRRRGEELKGYKRE